MGIKNLKGGHVAKQKNPRKIMQEQINEIGGGINVLFNEVRTVKQHLVGMENVVMFLAEFLKKRKKFEKFLESKLKEQEELSKEEPSK